tara:strand:- start:71 stop:262 length:192 start_codon:yes stop_codon:yes gene_type:complete
MNNTGNWTYKLLGKHTSPELSGKDIDCILRIEDNIIIPKTRGNMEYEQYLLRVEAGYVPEAAD